MWNNFLIFLAKKNTILFAYIISAIAASLSKYFSVTTQDYTNYNNFVIFKQSFFHLLSHKNLYLSFPSEQMDLFKYSPTFALFMGLFAWLPNCLGLILFNEINALLLFFGFWLIPLLSEKTKIFMLYFALFELFSSMQNAQTNAAMAGLILLAFSALELKNIKIGTLCIAVTFFIKIFGIVAFALFFFSKEKIKFILWSILWLSLLAFIPVFFIGFSQLIFQYQNWLELLKADHDASFGLSVMGVFSKWFGLIFLKNTFVLLGAALFLLPFLRIKCYENFQFRLLSLASILLWIVIFNHRAESPTFIIAISGVAIWFFRMSQTRVNLILFIFAFLVTSVCTTDIVPVELKKDFYYPYLLKVVPCILIWCKIIYEQMTLKPTSVEY